MTSYLVSITRAYWCSCFFAITVICLLTFLLITTRAQNVQLTRILNHIITLSSVQTSTGGGVL